MSPKPDSTAVHALATLMGLSIDYDHKREGLDRACVLVHVQVRHGIELLGHMELFGHEAGEPVWLWRCESLWCAQCKGSATWVYDAETGVVTLVEHVLEQIAQGTLRP